MLLPTMGVALALAFPAAGFAPALAPLYAIDFSRGQARLVQVDPVTLARVGSVSAPLGEHWLRHAFSPRRTQVALGGDGPGSIRVVDLRRMGVVGDVQLAPAGSVDWMHWLAPRRLVAVVQRSYATIVIVDPVRLEVVARRPLDSRIHASTRAGERVVLLQRPTRGIGSTRLLVLHPAGALRTVVLRRILSGHVDDEDAYGPVVRRAEPGLAVDPDRGVAYVFGANGEIAVVDLATLEVTYRGLRWPLSRARAAKDVVGWYRSARWLGGGLVAVTGWDWQKGSVGLVVLDTRAWEAHTIDPTAGSFTYARGLLLAVVGREGSPALAAYGLDGALRFKIAESKLVGGTPDTQGRYAYLLGQDYRTTVIELGSGSVLGRPWTKHLTLLAAR